MLTYLYDYCQPNRSIGPEYAQSKCSVSEMSYSPLTLTPASTLANRYDMEGAYISDLLYLFILFETGL